MDKKKKYKNPLSAHCDRASVCNIGQMALRSSRYGPFTLVVRLASSFGNITEAQHPVNPSALTQVWKDREALFSVQDITFALATPCFLMQVNNSQRLKVKKRVQK